MITIKIWAHSPINKNEFNNNALATAKNDFSEIAKPNHYARETSGLSLWFAFILMKATVVNENIITYWIKRVFAIYASDPF
jgi:hypothetical protein